MNCIHGSHLPMTDRLFFFLPQPHPTARDQLPEQEKTFYKQVHLSGLGQRIQR